ncbi:hypothetical protein U0358_03700 [Idiomarina sp. PL1-037]|uniref:hypothetical protein n=1 Tax=unclassified Idiomarina TaxID=2614829 RepID=UPI002ACBF0C8|nr:hypothetical protein [Idiomarina sp. PL1-037]WQC53672.1 hypothetical protein U0358_03700 [Idiomarina sp. PL1-037]
MAIYRWGGAFDNLTLSHSMVENMANRLEQSFVDRTALNSLARVVEGDIQSFDDLLAAERAIRAFCFHQTTHEIAPCASLKTIFENGNSFEQSIYPSTLNRHCLQSILDECGFHVHIAPIDQLIAFENESLEERFVRRQNEKSQEESEFARKLRELGHNEPVFELDFQRLPLIKVAEHSDEYFEDVALTTDKQINSYLVPLSASGRTAYLGNRALASSFDRLKNYNGDQFFKTIDDSWVDWATKMERVIDIPVPPLLAIVLDRSGARSEIPAKIKELRAELSYSSNQLWELFDDAEFRLDSEAVSYRVLDDIQSEASKLFDSWKKRGRFEMPFRFNLLGRIFQQDALGLLKDVSFDAFSSDLAKSAISVDAAQVTRQNLASVNFSALAKKHFNDREQTKLSQVTLS